MSGLLITELKLWEIIPGPNIFHTIVIICLALSMIWYRHRRYCYPLKGRGSRAILSCCGLYVTLMISLDARGPGWPCIVDFVIFSIGAHCGCGVYVYRVLVLLVKHDIAQEISLGLNSHPQNRSCFHNPKFTPFLKFRRWIFVLVSYGMLVGLVFASVAISQGDAFQCRGRSALYLNLSLFIIFFPTMLCLSFKLRKFPSDARKISVEFRCMACFIIVAVVTQIVLSQLGLAYVPAYTAGVLILDFVGVALMSTNLLFPIYLSYQFRGKHQRTDSNSSLTRSLTASDFNALLDSVKFREAFLLHLKSEFSAESLVFWQAVTAFKEKGERPAEQMIPEMKEIFDTYLVPTAPYLLNTSLSSVEDTKVLFQRAQESGVGFLTVFDGILHEILALMRCDPLPRFFRTPAGRGFAPQHSDLSKRSPSSASREPMIERDTGVVVSVESATRRLSDDESSSGTSALAAVT